LRLVRRGTALANHKKNGKLNPHCGCRLSGAVVIGSWFSLRSKKTDAFSHAKFLKTVQSSGESDLNSGINANPPQKSWRKSFLLSGAIWQWS
jgi:hypothetical protein